MSTARAWGTAILLASLSGGCQAPDTRLAEADIPAGRTLVTDGIVAGGTRVVVIMLPETGCRTPQVWSRTGAAWREAATGEPLAADPCPVVTARLAPDGRTLAIYDFSAGRAQLLELGADGFAPAGVATIDSAEGSRFPPPGPNLAFAADGSRLLLGSINRGCRIPAPGERYCGMARLFTREGGGWREVATLVPPAEADGLTRFGQAVALSPDGTMAVAGGTAAAGGSGALWVYRLDGPEPVLAGTLGPPEPQPGFGNALSWSVDGVWLAVGGDQAVHLFAREGQSIAWRKSLTPPDAAAGYFGETVALSGDGRLLLVGAPRAGCAEGDRCGVAYLFDRDRGWSLARAIRPQTNAEDANFGHHLAISRDGRHLAVQGAVIHVFTPGGG